MTTPRYSLPGFERPEASKAATHVTLRPLCSLEIDLGPAFEGMATPSFRVQLLSRYGTVSECVFSSETGELIFHRTRDEGRRLVLIIYHTDIIKCVDAGDYDLVVGPDVNTLEGKYEERCGQYVATRKLSLKD